MHKLTGRSYRIIPYIYVLDAKNDEIRKAIKSRLTSEPAPKQQNLAICSGSPLSSNPATEIYKNKRKGEETEKSPTATDASLGTQVEFAHDGPPEIAPFSWNIAPNRGRKRIAKAGALSGRGSEEGKKPSFSSRLCFYY